MRVDISDLIGVRYEQSDDIKKGFNCFSYVQEIQKRFGREISIESLLLEPLKQTDEPKFGDLIMFYDGNGRGRHCGVFLEDNRYTHCDSLGSHVSTFDETDWAYWRFYTW